MKNRLIVCSLALISIVSTSLAIYLLFERQLSAYSSIECTQSEEFRQNDIVVSLAPDTVISSEVLTLRYTNNSDTFYVYDCRFILQVLNSCSWELVPFRPNIGVLLTLFGIESGSYKDLRHSLNMLFELHKGNKYRIIREFTPVTDDPDAQSIEVIFEFRL